tara:strand:+ start:595 stop:1230 length:636 start_codon:yes stop_codon:yes gene_type:complete
MVKSNKIYYFGIAALVVGYLFKDKISFGADSNGKSIIDTIKERFTPSELEQVHNEKSGATVDIIPQSLTSSFLGQEFLGLDRADRVVNMSSFGTGVADVRIETVNPYDYELSAEDFRADTVGQENTNGLNLNIMKSVRPSPLNPSIDIAGFMNAKTNSDTLNPTDNAGYTDGVMTKTLANWSKDHHIQREGNDVAFAVPMNGSTRKQLRRV